MHIGERIKQRRIELEWSQRDLAKKMGYTNNSTIVKIEQGKVDVYQNKIVQFSEVLGVSIAYLMGWEEDEETKDTKKSPSAEITEGEQKLLELFRRVPENRQPMVLQMIEVALKNLE